MGIWPVQDAKSKFSEMLENCLANGPQIVTRRGKQEAVLVPIDEWQRLSARAKPSIKDVLLGEGPRFEMELPDRGKRKLRVRMPFE